VDQSMQAPSLPVRPMNVPWRAFAFVGLLLFYVVLIIGVVHQSPLLTMDHDVWRLNLRRHYPGWWPFINTYVVLGQRAPSTFAALPWFLWMAWRRRSAQPLIMLTTALLALNLSVGAVKLATGRVGPLATHKVHDVFAGGDIFPSGHTANTVVLYGVLAILAVSHRRLAVAAAVFIALTVGLSTVYLDTHWLTDVVGGWMAGGLVLLALPTLMPWAERLTAVTARWLMPRLRGALARRAADALLPVLAEDTSAYAARHSLDESVLHEQRVPAQL